MESRNSKYYKKVSAQTGFPEEVVKEAYESFWKSIRTTIEAMNLKGETTREEFEKMRPCFNIPSLGKLYCTYDKYKGIKEIYKKTRKLYGNNQTDQDGHSDI